MEKFYLTVIAVLLPITTWAEVDRAGNVINEDGGSEGSIFGPQLIPILAGAAIGYFVERAYRKSKMDKIGSIYSSEYLGGKTGAIIGAIALPLLIGLLR